MRLRYARGALADLDEIFAYIARDNPPAAARLVARIESAAKRMCESPYIGEATSRPRFRIVYEVGQDEVIIQYVRHGARRRPWEEE